MKPKRQYWTEGEVQRLKELYPHHSTSELAGIFGYSEGRIYNKAFALGLKKSADYMQEMLAKTGRNLIEHGKDHRFKRGQSPANKGKRQTDYMSADAIERSKATRFKKGHNPHNAIPTGGIIIRQRKDRSEPPYKWIKPEGKRRLVMLHRHLWESANGKIPEGYNIIFKDGNTLNCDLSNLEIVSNAELMERNTIHRYPAELKTLIHLNSKLKREINHVEQHNI